MSPIPCRRCLLSEADEKAVYASVQEYIQSLSPEVKTDDAEYHRRLNLCRLCSHLNRGTCQKCGCYVEARAAKRAQSCPDIPGKW